MQSHFFEIHKNVNNLKGVQKRGFFCQYWASCRVSLSPAPIFSSQRTSPLAAGCSWSCESGKIWGPGHGTMVAHFNKIFPLLQMWWKCYFENTPNTYCTTCSPCTHQSGVHLAGVHFPQRGSTAPGTAMHTMRTEEVFLLHWISGTNCFFQIAENPCHEIWEQWSEALRTPLQVVLM